MQNKILEILKANADEIIVNIFTKEEFYWFKPKIEKELEVLASEISSQFTVIAEGEVRWITGDFINWSLKKKDNTAKYKIYVGEK
jgi:hypothetical protein